MIRKVTFSGEEEVSFCCLKRRKPVSKIHLNAYIAILIIFKGHFEDTDSFMKPTLTAAKVSSFKILKTYK